MQSDGFPIGTRSVTRIVVLEETAGLDQMLDSVVIISATSGSEDVLDEVSLKRMTPVHLPTSGGTDTPGGTDTTTTPATTVPPTGADHRRRRPPHVPAVTVRVATPESIDGLRAVFPSPRGTGFVRD